MGDQVVDAGQVDGRGRHGLRRVQADTDSGRAQRVEVDHAPVGRLHEADAHHGRVLVDGVCESLQRRKPKLDSARLERLPGEHGGGEVPLVENDVRAGLERQARGDEPDADRDGRRERDVLRPRADELGEERAAGVAVLLPVAPAPARAPAFGRLGERRQRRTRRQAVGGAVEIPAGWSALVLRRREQWPPTPPDSRRRTGRRDPGRAPAPERRDGRSWRSASSGAPARR